jgi:putative transposase
VKRVILTYRYRIKDATTAKRLRAHARAVNPDRNSDHAASTEIFAPQLRYKASRHGARYLEVEETGSSASCSACGARSGPKGQKGLRVRAWVCHCCHARHDRDINAAVNLLLRAERRPPAVEIPVL